MNEKFTVAMEILYAVRAATRSGVLADLLDNALNKLEDVKLVLKKMDNVATKWLDVTPAGQTA